ncbi:uncharacterized protein LOC131151746 [Malania oleifera]|uniref:uncharacterized protein LOC131151746 n=1 Tax=Malania oleifera TaxID=397392 RepID=UPI0025AE452A|nr:uncharacterized protein LOC131151746 [Malania oleifera]
MGNEMGNSNITGLQEEEKTKVVEAPKKYLQEAVKADDVKEDNHAVPLAEDEDFSKKSAAGKGETGFHSSPEGPVESNDTGGENSPGTQQIYSSKDLIDHGKPVESVMEDDQQELETNDHQIQEKMSTTRDNETDREEETNYTICDTLSASQSPEPLESVDPNLEQHGMGEIHDSLSEKDSGGESQGSDEIIQSSLSSESEEKADLLDTEMIGSLAESAVSVTDPKVEKGRNDSIAKETKSQEWGILDRSICIEKFETAEGEEVGNGLSKTSNFQSDTSKESEVGFFNEMNLCTDYLSVLKPEVLPPTDSLFSTDQKVSGPNGSENELNTHDPIPTRLCEDLLKEMETGEANGRDSSTDMNLNRDDFPVWEPEVIPPPDMLVNSYQNVLEPEEKHMIDPEETKLIGNESEVNEHDPIPTQSCEEWTKELETDGANDFQSEFMQIAFDHGSDGIEILIEDCEIEAAKANKSNEQIDSCDNMMTSDSQVTENGDRVDLYCINLGSVSRENCKESNGDSENMVSVSGNGIVPSESTAEDYTKDGVQLTERNIVINVMEREKDAYAMQNETGGEETAEQCFSHEIEVAEKVLSPSPANPVQSQDYKQDSATRSETVQEIVTSGRYEAERLSTESSPDNLNSNVEMQKSPSFSLDLQTEEKTEISDQTPLLYRDKIVTLSGQVDASHKKPIVKAEYCRDKLQNRETPVQEKINISERSDSEKMKTPLLGFLKEEEESHIAVSAHKQDSLFSAKMTSKEVCNTSAKKAASTSPKGREKRKPRSSLFGNCMCCATLNTL